MKPLPIRRLGSEVLVTCLLVLLFSSSAAAAVASVLPRVIGQGVPKNLEQSRKWYEQAAEKSSCRTQFIVGQKYAIGDEAPVDHAAALKW